MDRASLKQLRVVDLKQILSKCGQSQSGNKSDLIERIAEYYEDKSNSVDEPDESTAVSEETPTTRRTGSRRLNRSDANVSVIENKKEELKQISVDNNRDVNQSKIVKSSVLSDEDIGHENVIGVNPAKPHPNINKTRETTLADGVESLTEQSVTNEACITGDTKFGPGDVTVQNTTPQEKENLCKDGVSDDSSRLNELKEGGFAENQIIDGIKDATTFRPEDNSNQHEIGSVSTQEKESNICEDDVSDVSSRLNELKEEGLAKKQDNQEIMDGIEDVTTVITEDNMDQDEIGSITAQEKKNFICKDDVSDDFNRLNELKERESVDKQDELHNIVSETVKLAENKPFLTKEAGEMYRRDDDYNKSQSESIFDDTMDKPCDISNTNKTHETIVENKLVRMEETSCVLHDTSSGENFLAEKNVSKLSSSISNKIHEQNLTNIFEEAKEKPVSFHDRMSTSINFHNEQNCHLNQTGQDNVQLKCLIDAEQFDEVILDENLKKSNKKKKKKKRKKNRPEQWAREAADAEKRKNLDLQNNNKEENGVIIEYIPDSVDLDSNDPVYKQFSKVFDVFKISTDEDGDEKHVARKITDTSVKTSFSKSLEDKTIEVRSDEEDGAGEDDDANIPKLSKKKLKKLNRLSVAELKQLVTRSDVVEMHDVTARDPRLLVHLKSARNSVPVPRHWCFKRKYLQAKRGFEKPPFDLPDFIKKTGIMEMRAALQEKEQDKNLKTKMREKVRPKLGKIDIDYQKLHDAFFKYQTKPPMTSHGDLYYEGKEFEIRLKQKKCGELSDEMRTALGMPVGPNAYKVPPPWLIAMQRYGPPPSYPTLRIPGLNAPIPEGCSFGYHAGGWGKPPVDDTGKPLYGDVFGTSDVAFAQAEAQLEDIDKSLWGELDSDSEQEDSDDENDDDEDEGKRGDADGEVISGLQTPIVDAGLATPSGLSSVGIETPELIELRKRKIEADMEAGADTPNLYSVLPERKVPLGGAGMMASTHTYDMPVTFNTGDVELALNPEEVDLMDTEAMALRAAAAMKEAQFATRKEDFSDMVAEHAARQSNKRKRQAVAGKEGASADKGSKDKKYRGFKF